MDWPTFTSQSWELFLGMAKGTTLIATFGVFLSAMFLWLLFKAQRNHDNPIEVTDLLRDPATGQTSRRAVGELVGLFVSTFLVVAFAASEIADSQKVLAFMFYSLLWVARSLLGAFLQMRFTAAANGGDDDDAPPRAPPAGPPQVITTTTAVPMPQQLRGAAAAPPRTTVKKGSRKLAARRRGRGGRAPE